MYDDNDDGDNDHIGRPIADDIELKSTDEQLDDPHRNLQLGDPHKARVNSFRECNDFSFPLK